MKIDLAKIDAQIKRLEEVRRIASDPDLLSLLETVVVTNGVNGTSLHRPSENPPVGQQQRTDPLSKLQKGTKVHAIAECALKQEKPFSGYDITKIMTEEGYQFPNGKTPTGVAVSDVLRLALLKKGIVRIHRAGKGKGPTLFERIQ